MIRVLYTIHKLGILTFELVNIPYKTHTRTDILNPRATRRRRHPKRSMNLSVQFSSRVCVCVCVCYILHTLTLVQRDNDAHIWHIHICTAQCLRMYAGSMWCLSVFGFRRLSDLYKIVGTSRRAVSSQ